MRLDTKYNCFRGKKILITAGPTWVAIDKARVISNIASGQTGVMLAEKLAKRGAKVTLILGPGQFSCKHKNINVLNYKYFHELKKLFFGQIKNNKFWAVIHSAAVSDYQTEKVFPVKIASGKNKLRLELVPTLKLIDRLKTLSKTLKVGFKFEPLENDSQLILAGERLLGSANLDLVVANSNFQGYRAYILGKNQEQGPFKNKKSMVLALYKSMALAIGGQSMVF